MNTQKTNIDECIIIRPDIHEDDRGVFFESFNDFNYYSLFKCKNFIQDNVSIFKKNVLRGLHYQTGKFAQSKLITVYNGSVQDVVVDCRINSPSYGNIFTIFLDGKGYKQLYVPRGCAHGFLALEDNTILSYKIDNAYEKESETGIIYNDSDLNIIWHFDEEMERNILNKDEELSTWKECYKFE